MKKMLFIFNPNSGKGLIKNYLMKIIDIFVKAGYEVTAYPTQARYDASQTAGSRGKEFDVIVCSGGDGTLGEVIKGLMSLDRKIPLGYIPSGTMNDFASSLGIPKDMEEAALRICKSGVISVDVGSFNEEYFTYIAGFGVFTDVSYETSQNMKNMFGHLAYVMEVMRRLNTAKSYHITVSHDGVSIEDDFIFGMVSNSCSVGGLKGLSGKEVLLDDGVFEVFLIKMPKSIIEFQQTINCLVRRELESGCFYLFKSAEIEFHSDDDLPWTLDGEFGGNCRNVCIKNKCRAVDIFTNQTVNITGFDESVHNGN